MKELDFEFVADEKAPRISRVLVEELRALFGTRSDDVKLLVSELVTNSVRHAALSETVRVRVKVADDRIRLEVIDQGAGFSEIPMSIGGLGLVIVEQLAEDWGVQMDGNFTVWVELGRSSEEADAAY
jgi:two-component sensor histidine kinase